MRRLTLHILLSFAQFEREVTSERIRDKVRASRMKSMWMGRRAAARLRGEGQEAGHPGGRSGDRPNGVRAVRGDWLRRGRMLVITPDGTTKRPRPRIDSVLVKAVAGAHRWQRMLESGECASITDLAAAERINRSYMCRVLRLTLLVPGIIEAILDGRQPEEVTLPALMRTFPVDRKKQLTCQQLA